MSNNYEDNDFVDLTNSFILVNHCALTNSIIDLDTDDSFIEDDVIPGPPLSVSPGPRKSNRTILSLKQSVSSEAKVPKNKIQKKKKSTARESFNEAESKFGSCPICWDELGKNPLVSTKCGHVYCLKCLKKSLCTEKRCPTCRTVLKGKNAYHPLYLPV